MYAIGGNNVAAQNSAAKFALSGLTNSLARELAERDTMVNAVAPGFVLTGYMRTKLSAEDPTR